MINDFSSVFDGKQTVETKAVSYRQHGMFRKVSGIVLTGALVIGFVSCIIFGLLIRSGLKELEVQQSVKLELMKNQQGLYEQRNALLDKDKIQLAANNLGLYSPNKRQVKHL